MDQHILDVVTALNPWITDPGAFPSAAAHRVPAVFIERNVPGMGSWPVAGKAHLVTGARQVGKSSLVWHWILARSDAPLYLDAEEPAIRSWCASPALMLRDVRGLVRPSAPILIDEAQHLPEAGLLVKGLVDGGLENPLFVTGSSAFHLAARTRESLAGRAIRIRLGPLSLEEIAPREPEAPPHARTAGLRQAAERHMVAGGYPEAWTSADPRAVLAGLVEAHVIRDASDFHRVREIDAFRTVLGLVAGQAGNLVNLSEWASIAGVSRGTIASWVDILEQTGIAFLARPFSGARRAEITGRPKVYMCDGGLRNAIVRCMDPMDGRQDRGQAFENWVAGQLRARIEALLPGDELRFWRSKAGAEVDFVIARPGGIVAIEAKASHMRSPSLGRSARSFMEAYRPGLLVVVNLSLVAEERIGETLVRWAGPEAMADPSILLP